MNLARPPGLLASVSSLEEALAARAAGADIIDCKDPRAGALGALPVSTVRAIVKAMAGEVPVSATVGNLTLDPQAWTEGIQAMTAPGADIIKIGLLPPGSLKDCLAAVRPLAELYPLVAVMFVDVHLADESWDTVIAQVAEAGFLGVMLDTALKGEERLTTLCRPEALGRFVTLARDADLICGLAGKLRETDVTELAALQPDYLGFRSALCENGDRTGGLSEARVAAVKAALQATSW